jgi:hypothetical protein
VCEIDGRESKVLRIGGGEGGKVVGRNNNTQNYTKFLIVAKNFLIKSLSASRR